jgi:hypothetical protein
MNAKRAAQADRLAGRAAEAPIVQTERSEYRSELAPFVWFRNGAPHGVDRFVGVEKLGVKR